jgi:hypothetical protein
LFKSTSSNFELIRTGDGQTLQNGSYYTAGSTYVYDADYKNKMMIMLDNIGTIVTINYTPD